MAIHMVEDYCAPAESPFYAIRTEELSAICASSGFQILRQYLSQDGGHSAFCDQHNNNIGPVVQSIWVLHRDILHGLTMPVVQLLAQASALAYAALCTENKDDLELAFRGEARSAFLWLQCFIEEEEDWCYTKGCPACTTLHILSSEHTVRATLAAAQLSVPRGSKPALPAEEISDPNDRSLPNFLATIPALESALCNDSFWGPGTYEHLLDRSSRLATGIHDLISQCAALETLVTSAPSSPTGILGLDIRRGQLLSDLFAEQNGTAKEEVKNGRAGKEIQLKKSRLAKRQARLREEQKAMITRMAWQCFSAVQLPAEQRMALRSAGRKAGMPRRRTLTNP